MPTFELAGLKANPGEKAHGSLGHVTLGDGTQVHVPAMIANGREDGPTFLVTASVHGTEVVGVGATIEAMKAINPNELRGTVIAVTASNPFAFQEASYDTPYDHINLSTPIFKAPKPNGLLTERIAAIVMQAAEPAKHMIDMHANPDPSIPFVLYSPGLCKDEQTLNESKRLAEAFGVTVIEMGGAPNTADIRYDKGLTTMTPELTGNMFLRDETVAVGKNGILNVMKALNMIDGEPVMHASKMEGDFVFHGRLISNAGGLLWVRRKPGEFIRQGETIIEIVNLYGEVQEQVKMPVDGYVWAFGGRPGTSHVVAEGTAINYVFKKRG